MSYLRFKIAGSLLFLTLFYVPKIFSQTQGAGKLKGKVVLAVFAHPDDETSVTPVLSRYAADGADVYLAIATDGRYGVTAHAGIPAGDSLSTVRTRELICAAQQLGIKPPITFGLHDQLKMQGGFGPIHDQLSVMRSEVTKLIEKLQPDVLITWPASGWTGHHDHRLVHTVVTEVYESRDWVKPIELFYPALPFVSGAPSPPGFATVNPKFLTVKVEATESDYIRARNSLYCHKSQYTTTEMDNMRGMITSALGKVTYFIPYKKGKTGSSLFD